MGVHVGTEDIVTMYKFVRVVDNGELFSWPRH